MFLFSFIFSPFFVGASTTIWSYTTEVAGVITKHDFSGEADCNVSLLNYKKGPLAGKTTPCESSTSNILVAAKPTMTASLFSEQQDGSTGKFAWVLQIKTANISNGVMVTGAVYDTGAGSTIIDRNTATINNNSATYYTKGSILENNKEYMLVLNATNDKKISTNVWFTKTVGKEGATITTKELDLTTSDPVPVTPQTETPATGSDTYNLLAPIGGMNTAPDNMGDYFNKIFLIVIGLCGALAVVMLIIGGIQYMGEDSVFGKTKAKEQITSAILGLVIALVAYALLNTINPELLGGKGVAIKQLSVEIQDEIETSPWEGTSSGDNSALCPEGYTNVTTPGTPSSINVCKSISSNLTKLLAAAKTANIILSGSGSRNFNEQTAMWNEKKCNPPGTVNCNKIVAKPGTSMHESGMAIDFRCDNKAIGKQDYSNKCVVWLAKNAINYGFKNLPGEAWHWSTGPKAGH